MDEEPIRIPITDVFDLHTVPARDVKPIVEEYLQEAHGLGFKALRIIHGRGIGVQREVVRSILAQTPFVESFAKDQQMAVFSAITALHYRAGRYGQRTRETSIRRSGSIEKLVAHRKN